MWLTNAWQVKTAYAFVTLTFAGGLALAHPDGTTRTTPGPTIYLTAPPGPPPPPRLVVRYHVRRVPGPVRVVTRTVTQTRTVTETQTVTVPGPTVSVPGPTRTVTVVKRIPAPPPPPVPPPPTTRRHHGKAKGHLLAARKRP